MLEANLESLPSVAVVIVSFGVKKGAEQWVKETNCQFPVYLDPNRRLYRFFGLHRSLFKVFNHKTLQYYGEKKSAGVTLPSAIAGVEDDPLQMGGDFTINCAKKTMQFLYPSKQSDDRPALSHIRTHL